MVPVAASDGAQRCRCPAQRRRGRTARAGTQRTPGAPPAWQAASGAAPRPTHPGKEGDALLRTVVVRAPPRGGLLALSARRVVRGGRRPRWGGYAGAGVLFGGSLGWPVPLPPASADWAPAAFVCQGRTPSAAASSRAPNALRNACAAAHERLPFESGQRCTTSPASTGKTPPGQCPPSAALGHRVGGEDDGMALRLVLGDGAPRVGGEGSVTCRFRPTNSSQAGSCASVDGEWGHNDR